MHCAVAVILGDLGPEQKQERETDGKVFHPCLHMQIAASFSTVTNFVQNNQNSLHNLPFQSKEFCKDPIFLQSFQL